LTTDQRLCFQLSSTAYPANTVLYSTTHRNNDVFFFSTNLRSRKPRWLAQMRTGYVHGTRQTLN